jgi:hypothetical protein
MIKNILLTILAISFFESSYAQTLKPKNVPAPVLAGMKKYLPMALLVEWEKEDSDYEANFFVKDSTGSLRTASALFNATGTLLEIEMIITKAELPSGVLDYINSNYGNPKIKEVSQVSKLAGPKTYEIEIKGKKLIFDSEGKFIKEEKD